MVCDFSYELVAQELHVWDLLVFYFTIDHFWNNAHTNIHLMVESNFGSFRDIVPKLFFE